MDDDYDDDRPPLSAFWWGSCVATWVIAFVGFITLHEWWAVPFAALAGIGTGYGMLRSIRRRAFF